MEKVGKHLLENGTDLAENLKRKKSGCAEPIEPAFSNFASFLLAIDKDKHHTLEPPKCNTHYHFIIGNCMNMLVK